MSVKPVNRVVKITNVSDFVTPSQQCVLKTPAAPAPASSTPPQQGVVALRTRKPLSLNKPSQEPPKPVKLNLADCLTCSGCVTSTEEW